MADWAQYMPPWTRESGIDKYLKGVEAATSIAHAQLQAQQVRNNTAKLGLELKGMDLSNQMETLRINNAVETLPLQRDLAALKVQAEKKMQEAELHDQAELASHVYDESYTPRFMLPDNQVKWMGMQANLNWRKAQVIAAKNKADQVLAEQMRQQGIAQQTAQGPIIQDVDLPGGGKATFQGSIDPKTGEYKWEPIDKKLGSQQVPELTIKRHLGHSFLWTGQTWSRIPDSKDAKEQLRHKLIISDATERLKSAVDEKERSQIISDTMSKIGVSTVPGTVMTLKRNDKGKLVPVETTPTPDESDDEEN